ncbi:MAG: M20 family metallopeptidase [Pseudomonadota bacterium]
METTAIDETLAGRLVAILSELIAIPSPYPPGDSVAIAAYAAERLRNAGYRVDIATRRKGVDNVIAKLGSGRPRVVFNAHLDTVGVGDRTLWTTDPFAAAVRQGQVIGLGAANCKGSMAVQLWLAEELVRAGGPQRGEVAFTFVADEENLGPDGTAFLREAGYVKPDTLIVGAPTDNEPIVAERGVLWARITSTGRAAHAGNPAAGDNAILRMVRIVGSLEANLAPKLVSRREGPMQSTINLGLIKGGENTNVVPAACMAEIDRRLLPGEDVRTAFAELARAVREAGEPESSFKIEFLTGTNGFHAPAGGQGIAAWSAEIEARTGAKPKFRNALGASDGRYFADDGIEIIVFGPGSDAQGHATNEAIPVEQMVAAARIQKGALDRLVGS